MSPAADAVVFLEQALSGTCRWSEHGGEDLDRLREAAIAHGVAALVWQALPADHPLRAALQPDVRNDLSRDVFVQRDLQLVVQALADAGVPALLTKGAALAYTAYPQPWLRPRLDTDILVRHADLPAAAQALEGCGYRRTDALSTGALVSHQVAFERTDAHGVPHVIDLHWKIANPQLLADTLQFEYLWPAAQPVAALGPAAHAPSPVASVALACIHRLAHHHGYDRLIWLYDLKVLTAGLSREAWTSLANLAGERQVAGLCLDGLRQARSRVGSQLPLEIEQALAAAAPGEPSRRYLQGPVPRREVLVSDLKTLPSWRARVQLVIEHGFPPASFIRQRYGGETRWPLPALYLHRLVTGASKWVRS